MSRSESLNELAIALAKAQGQIKGALKDATNPHFRSRYADLASTWEACRAPLSDNGLSVIQMPDRNGMEVAVTTLLLHSSGQWISSRLSTIPGKIDPQGIGSAITYLRRYALAAVVGIAPEDDDGEGATARPSGPPMANGPEWSGTSQPVGQGKKKPAPMTPDEALKKIAALKSTKQADDLAKLLAEAFPDGPTRAPLVEAFRKKRASLVTQAIQQDAAGGGCEACGAKPGHHVDGCPLGPGREPGAEG